MERMLMLRRYFQQSWQGGTASLHDPCRTIESWVQLWLVRPAFNCPLCIRNLDIIVSRAFLLCLRGDSRGSGCSDGDDKDGEPLSLRASELIFFVHEALRSPRFVILQIRRLPRPSPFSLTHNFSYHIRIVYFFLLFALFHKAKVDFLESTLYFEQNYFFSKISENQKKYEK
jgi:hypothetical protein